MAWSGYDKEGHEQSQVTLPKEAREKLAVSAGDFLVYELEGTSERVRKAAPFDLAWHRAISSTLEEWGSEYDQESFDDL